MSASHRVALVTGASRGLGEVIARVLAERGDDLAIGARDGAALTRVADMLKKTGNTSRVIAVEGDITDSSVRVRLIEAARQLGGLDLLINNASELGGIGPLLTFDVQRFGRVFP